MENLVYLLPVVGCAAMMGVMMWMMRGNGKPAQPQDGTEASTREEIATLRAELAALREQQGEPGHPAPDQSYRR